MERQLILISNPGNPNDTNYIKASEDAIETWKEFFCSPIGGYWQEKEIQYYGESNPISPDELRRLMVPLNSVQCNYSVIVFCGHGGCTSDEKDAIQLPIPTDGNINLFPVDELLGEGLPFVKRTVILDACRTLIPYTSKMLFEGRMYSDIFKLEGFSCEEYYNELIEKADPHVEVLYSTSLHQQAFASMNGSEYTDAMSGTIIKNFSLWKQYALYEKYGRFSYSLCELQKDLTTELVNNRNKQIPEYKIKGKTNSTFPFVAIRMPNDRTINKDDADVEVTED